MRCVEILPMKEPPLHSQFCCHLQTFVNNMPLGFDRVKFPADPPCLIDPGSFIIPNSAIFRGVMQGMVTA